MQYLDLLWLALGMLYYGSIHLTKQGDVGGPSHEDQEGGRLGSHGWKLSGLSGVAQWLACWAHTPKVRGSKPRSATFPFAFLLEGP